MRATAAAALFTSASLFALALSPTASAQTVAAPAPTTSSSAGTSNAPASGMPATATAADAQTAPTASAPTPDANPQTQAAPAATPDAGNGLGDIVVTARRQNENLQKVPVSVSIIGADTINKRGNVSMQDIAQLVPGVGVSSGNDRSDADVTIRGQSRSPSTLAPAVITYFNEVPLPRVSGASFYDLENVQILKGPQGTLFGRVTDGGAVLLTSRKPTNDFDGYLDVTLGDYALHKFQGAVNIPIVDDKVLLRVAGSINRRDGFTYNLFNNTKLDNVHTDDFRVSLVLRPNDKLENYTVFAFGQSDENCCGSVLVGYNPFTTTPDYAAQQQAVLAAQEARGPRVVDEGISGYYHNGIYYTRNTKWVVNTTTWHVADNLTVKNIFGYIYNKETTGTVVDGATVPTGAPINTPGIGLPTNFRGQKSDELQVQGSFLDGKLTYTTGLYWEDQYSPGPTDQYVVDAGGAVQVSIVAAPHTTSKAVYGQASYDLGGIVKGLKFDAGIRYSADHVSSRQAEYVLLGPNPVPAPNLPRHGECLTAAELAVQFPGAIATPGCNSYTGSSDAVTYTLGLDWQIDSKRFFYASLRSGYRPGGINYGAGGTVGLSYQPEHALSREVGIKADWDIGGMRARTNLTAFWDTTHDLQQLVTDLASIPISGVVNTGIATVKGLEFEGTLIPFRGLNLTANYAYTVGHYDKSIYTAAQIAGACPADPYRTPPAPNGIVCPLRALNSLPRNVVSASAHYDLPLSPSIGTITIGGDFFYTAKLTPGSNNSFQYPAPWAPVGGSIPAYSLVNLDATWKNFYGQPIDLTIFVTNVTNKAYIQSLDDFLDAGSLGGEGAYYGPPRMYGFSIRYRFGG